MRKWLLIVMLSSIEARANNIPCHLILGPLEAIQQGLTSGGLTHAEAAERLSALLAQLQPQEHRVKVTETSIFPVDLHDKDSKLYVIRLKFEETLRNRNAKFAVADPRVYISGLPIGLLLNPELPYDAPTQYLYIEYWKQSEPDEDAPFKSPQDFASYFRGRSFPIELEATAQSVPLTIQRVIRIKDRHELKGGNVRAQIVVEMSEVYEEPLDGFAWAVFQHGRKRRFHKFMVDRSTQNAPEVTLFVGETDTEGVSGFVKMSEVPPTSIFELEYFQPSISIPIDEFVEQLPGKTIFLSPSHVRPWDKLFNPFHGP